MQSHVRESHSVIIPLSEVDTLFDSLTHLWNEFADDEDFKGFLIKHNGDSSSYGRVSVSPIFSSCSAVSYSDIAFLHFH